jgi:hypothetical protein
MKISGNKPWAFFALAFGISWLFWVPAAWLPGYIMESAWVILLYLGGLGPAAAAIFLGQNKSEAAAIKEYWARVFEFQRIGGFWYLVILLAYPAISLIATTMVQGRIQLAEPVQGMLGYRRLPGE